MKKIILALAALLASSRAFAAVGPQINGNQINAQTAISISTLTVTGAQGVTSSTITVQVDAQTPTSIPNSPLRAVGSANSDVQLQVQNKSNGASANAGIYVMADNGTNLTNGGWFGINGSGYVGATNGWFDGPDDVVAYALSGNMGLGASASGKAVNIFAGGSLGANVVEVISSTGTTILQSGFTVGYNVTKSSFVVAGGSATAAYQMQAGSFLTTGSGGYVQGSSSFTTTGGGFFGSLRDSGIASGTQCIQADSSGNLTGIGSPCATTTGFAQLASTQTWSGSNTFGNTGISTTTVTGNFTASNQVHISTGGTVYFAASAWANTDTTFLRGVTGSTVSFVVQGTTVACWMNGSETTTEGLGAAVLASVGVDGKVNVVPNTTASAGVFYGQPPTVASAFSMSFYVEFQVTSGVSHAFYLGVWGSGSGTTTWPASTGSWGCREVPSR